MKFIFSFVRTIEVYYLLGQLQLNLTYLQLFYTSISLYVSLFTHSIFWSHHNFMNMENYSHIFRYRQIKLSLTSSFHPISILPQMVKEDFLINDKFTFDYMSGLYGSLFQKLLQKTYSNLIDCHCMKFQKKRDSNHHKPFILQIKLYQYTKVNKKPSSQNQLQLAQSLNKILITVFFFNHLFEKKNQLIQLLLSQIMKTNIFSNNFSKDYLQYLIEQQRKIIQAKKQEIIEMQKQLKKLQHQTDPSSLKI